MNWSKSSESWDAAGRTQRNYRTRVQKMHAPVGTKLTFEAEGLSGEIACEGCGHHLCSCERQAPATPAADALKVGDRVWHTGSGPLDIGTIVAFENRGLRWPNVKWPDGHIADHSPSNLRRAGDTEWLRALPGDTLVRRLSWIVSGAHPVSEVFEVIARLQPPAETWAKATDWELAPGGAK